MFKIVLCVVCLWSVYGLYFSERNEFQDHHMCILNSIKAKVIKNYNWENVDISQSGHVGYIYGCFRETCFQYGRQHNKNHIKWHNYNYADRKQKHRTKILREESHCKLSTHSLFEFKNYCEARIGKSKGVSNMQESN